MKVTVPNDFIETGAKEIEKMMYRLQLIEKVKQMRTAQKNYFATRRKQFLFQSKELEREVDVMLKKL